MIVINPMARHDYPRRAALQRDLERYYNECMRSTTARRFKSVARREQYCSGVAWKRARASGRYKDYFRKVDRVAAENPLTKKNTMGLIVFPIAIVGVARVVGVNWGSSLLMGGIVLAAGALDASRK